MNHLSVLWNSLAQRETIETKRTKSSLTAQTKLQKVNLDKCSVHSIKYQKQAHKGIYYSHSRAAVCTIRRHVWILGRLSFITCLQWSISFINLNLNDLKVIYSREYVKENTNACGNLTEACTILEVQIEVYLSHVSRSLFRFSLRSIIL